MSGGGKTTTTLNQNEQQRIANQQQSQTAQQNQSQFATQDSQNSFQDFINRALSSQTSGISDQFLPFIQQGVTDALGLNDLLKQRTAGAGDVAAISPERNEALDLIANFARTPNAGVSAGQNAIQQLASGSALQPSIDTLSATARGDFLNPSANPFLQAAFDPVRRNIEDSVNSRFELAGRTGSPASLDFLARNVGDAANQFFGGNFQAERGRQVAAANQLADVENSRLSAAALAPALANQDFFRAGQLGLVGQQREDQALKEFNFPFSLEQERVGSLSDLISQLSPSLTRQQTGVQDTTGQQTGQASASRTGQELANALLQSQGSSLSNIDALLNSKQTQKQSGGLLSSILGGALALGGLFGTGGAFPLLGGAK